ncbi:MAG: membrane protein insertion efficiency factor YidD [Oscillospiraceae bacterium]|nr:membrane protein insertion efficiency factor YidD [Oscillospiraceae bacterium]
MISRLVSKILIGIVRLYQMTLSPLLGRNCRYMPTCSQYMIGAIQIHGPIRGVWLGIRRLLRCNPFGGWGYDPVPPKQNKNSGDIS